MAFSAVSSKSGKTYYLHTGNPELRGGQKVTIYFFAAEPRAGAIDEIPDGYELSENPNTGLPLLRKKNKKKK